MKKTITILLLTALCMTVLTSCDLGNGLVAELFGDGHWVIDADEDILYEPAVQVKKESPKLVKMGYLSITLVTARGLEKEIASAEMLSGWDGTLELEEYPDAVLLIKGYACYNVSDKVSYRYLANMWGMSGGMESYQLDEIERKAIGAVDAEYVQGFYIKLPLSDLEKGSNQVWLYGDSVYGECVFEELIEISMYTMETELPDCIEPPIEPETAVPDVEETSEELTYPVEDTIE
jgi:hypothetical protein